MQTGRIISHYQLIERIGRDNDTVIYRARDLKLERDVAVKLFSPEKSVSPTARERFRRESHIASLVTHPHICAVHDSGEEAGQAFLVCELLEGRALDEVLTGGPLPPERLMDLAIQLVDGVAAVHRRGLVHGNIKPSNVFITDEGHVKLLELGVMSAWWEILGKGAAIDGSSPTTSVERRAPVDSDVEGFHSYRSPEHLAGERLDPRSDLFSVGAVLYEMATGEKAFPGDTPSRIAAAIVSGAPRPATLRNPQQPAALEPIIQRAIEKAPDRRYQTAADLLADLRRARRRLETSSGTIPRPPARRRWLVPAAAVVLLILAAAGWWWRSRPATPVPRHALLVASVANGTNDPDFDGTLRQALTVHLGQSPFLDIVSDERVRQILQMMDRPPDTPLTHTVAREVCQRLGVSAMIEGSVSAVGRSTVVALVSTDCASGDTIGREQVEVERKEEVLRAVGRIASSMRRSLGESVASLEGHNVSIEEATTPSLEALKAYTAGVEKRAAGSEIESIPFFERAIELDRNFALAYTTLSSIYGGLGETGRGEEYARLAYEHRGSVSERERLFIAYQYEDRVTGDQLKAREALEVWRKSYPLDYRPPNALAVLDNRLGDYDRSIAEAQEAMRLNAAHPFPYSNLAYAYRGAGKYEDARRTAERAVSLGIETVPTRRLLYQLAELAGDHAAAQRHLAWANGRTRGFDLTGAHAQVAAFHGRMAEARGLFEQTIEEALKSGLSQIATGYAGQLALTEAFYGYFPRAIERARQIPLDTAYEPQLRAATALAVAGEIADADRWVRRMRDLRPSDTWLQSAYLPVADAALSIARGRPDAAIEALRRAAPYERGIVSALLPIFFRAEARLKAKAPQDAVREFQALLQNPGGDPFSPAVPLARLGLARALGATGDVAGSRREYLELMKIWAEADPDMPMLRQAQAELAGLPQ